MPKGILGTGAGDDAPLVFEQEMSPQSTTHHYVPQFLLRGFARDNRVATFDLSARRRYVQNVSNAAAENHLNTVRPTDGENSDIAERFIADKIEGPAGDIVSRIREGSGIRGDSERFHLALLIALQAVRTPKYRQEVDALAEQTMKLEMAGGGPVALRAALGTYLGHEPDEGLVLEAWDSIRDFDWGLSLPRESFACPICSGL